MLLFRTVLLLRAAFCSADSPYPQPSPPTPPQSLLVAAEPADYVHVYEMAGPAPRAAQEIDLFGEVSGVALPPCGSMLFVGVSGAPGWGWPGGEGGLLAAG